MPRILPALLWALVLAPSRATTQSRPASAPAWTAELRELITHELLDKRIPAVMVTVSSRDRVLWSEGFGFADPEARTPATPQTVIRAGSVSKLFTDLAIMRLVGSAWTSRCARGSRSSRRRGPASSTTRPSRCAT